MEPPLLRVHEVAQLLKVGKWTVHRWIEESCLEATKIGRRSLRVFQASVDALIEGNRTDAWGASTSQRRNVLRLSAAARNERNDGNRFTTRVWALRTLLPDLPEWEGRPPSSTPALRGMTR